MRIDGRCHCGYVTFEAEADPETTTICNCTDCQTMSGAPLRAVISTRPGTFMLLSGKPTEYRKTADKWKRPFASFLSSLRDGNLCDID
jgi:hypothetical protein